MRSIYVALLLSVSIAVALAIFVSISHERSHSELIEPHGSIGVQVDLAEEGQPPSNQEPMEIPVSPSESPRQAQLYSPNDRAEVGQGHEPPAAALVEVEPRQDPEDSTAPSTIGNTLAIPSYSEIFASEGADPDWSRTMVSRIYKELSTVEYSFVGIEADCRRTVCRIVLNYPQGIDTRLLHFHQQFTQLGRTLDAKSVLIEATPGQTPSSLVYIEFHRSSSIRSVALGAMAVQ